MNTFFLCRHFLLYSCLQELRREQLRKKERTILHTNLRLQQQQQQTSYIYLLSSPSSV